jgi:pimeloyl-ACP methyl ester carboxylesterase
MLQADLNNYKFNYVENGKGDLLVLVHGSASDHRTWDNQMLAFGNHYKAIAYSRRFHWPNKSIEETEDYSMTQHIQDLQEFLQYLGGGPVHLLGHSYGALICLHLAINDPKLIRTLILAEPPAVTLFVSNSPRPMELVKLLFSKPMLALDIVKFGANGIAPATKALKQNDLHKALEVFGKATLGASAYLNLSASRLDQARTNLIKAELLGSGFLPLDERRIRRIKIPTLLIAAQKSPRIWQELSIELKKLIPNSELNIIPEASHIMHEDDPSSYNAAVLSFLKNTTDN